MIIQQLVLISVQFIKSSVVKTYKIQDTLFSKSGPLEGMIQHL